MLHVSMNVNGVPFLLFASASDFSLSPVADFKSTKSVNTAKQNVVLGLKKGYTILLHFRVGSIQYHAVLYLILRSHFGSSLWLKAQAALVQV